MTSRRRTPQPANADRQCSQYAQLFWPIHRWNDCEKVKTHEMLICPDHNDVINSPINFDYLIHNTKEISIPNDNFFNPPRSKSFWTGFRQSNEAYFIDKYFEKENINYVVIEEVLRAFNEARRTPQSIVIFLETNNHNALNRQMTEELHGGGVTKCQINVLRFPDGYQIHDRFALFDDNFWHCGATVGGVHRAFHAISGPWKDINRQLKKLFDKMQTKVRS